MPFKSEAQRKFLYARHPKIAERWQAHTPKGKELPEKVGDQSRRPKGGKGGGQWGGYVASPLHRGRPAPSKIG